MFQQKSFRKHLASFSFHWNQNSEKNKPWTFEKFTLFWIESTFQSVMYIPLGSVEKSDVVKTAFYVSRGTFCEKKWKKNLFLQVFWSWSEQLQRPINTNSAGLSRLHSTCHEEFFERNELSRNSGSWCSQSWRSKNLPEKKSTDSVNDFSMVCVFQENNEAAALHLPIFRRFFFCIEKFSEVFFFLDISMWSSVDIIKLGRWRLCFWVP